ncbi:MAG: SprT family zinc-dependent metalloprotease [Pseudomonadota bacterium]
MILRVAHGEVRLTVPDGVNSDAARCFAYENEAWLRTALGNSASPVLVSDGSAIPFRGKRLAVRASVGSKRFAVTDSEIYVPGQAAKLNAKLRVFLKEAAREALVKRVNAHCEAFSRPPSKITLRDPKSRWGSCNHNGDLMFSWRLIMAPDSVLDYVAAHEAAHLIEMNHSKAFWSLVKKLRPEFDEQRRWLRTNGSDLHRYRFDAPTTPTQA